MLASRTQDACAHSLRSSFPGIDRFHDRDDAVRWLVPLSEFACFGQRLLSRATNVSPKLWPFKVFWFSNLDVPDTATGAFQYPFWIGQGGAVIEPKIRSLGINGNVKNAIAESVARAIANCDCTVRVVD